MSVPILICECGMRLKVAGAAPGKVGRCPNCGSTLQVPDLAVPKESESGRNRASQPTEMGYGLMPDEEHAESKPRQSPSREDS